MENDTSKLDCCCSATSNLIGTVERLEVQMREMTVLMTQCESKKTEVETELKEAVDKIWVLRDIIRDLEYQIELKTKTETDFQSAVFQLQNKIADLKKQNEELQQDLDLLKVDGKESKYNTHISQLEDEIQRLRVSVELVGPDGVLKQVKTQLNDMEKSIEKRTKDLESLHACISHTNCSSPSEDMSLRDQKSAQTPIGGHGDCELPLEQLARLRDKLIKHSHAEDAAIKRIRDLEMHLCTSRQEYEDMQNERDILQEQLSEQMVLISSLQLRLDEQRLRVESVQKETNTALEHKIYELENEVHCLSDMVHQRDKNIKQLKVIIEETKSKLVDQQQQLYSASDNEKEIQNLQNEVQRLQSENADFQIKVQEAQSQVNQNSTADISELLNSMLVERNTDVEKMKSKLLETEKELSFYISLNFTKDELINLSHSRMQKTITDMINFNDEPDQLRRQEQSFESVHSNEHLRQNKSDTVFIGSSFPDVKFTADKIQNPFVVPEVFPIDKVESKYETCGMDNETAVLPSDSLPCDSHTCMNFENSKSLEKLEAKLNKLQELVTDSNFPLKHCEQNLMSLSEHIVDVSDLQKRLEYSEEILKDTTKNFKEEISGMKEIETNLRVELAEIKLDLQKNLDKLKAAEKESVRKDQLCMNIAKEKRDCENEIENLKSRLTTFENYEKQIIEKNKEIYGLEEQIAQMSDKQTVEHMKKGLKDKDTDLENLRKSLSQMEFNLNKNSVEKETLQETIVQKNELLEKAKKEYDDLSFQCKELTAQILNLEIDLKDKNSIIGKLEQDLQNEHKEIVHTTTQTEYEETKNDVSIQIDSTKIEYEKDIAEKEQLLIKNRNVIDELRKEIHHLQEFTKEKDKIINQMTIDSNSLHVALEGIQSKIQESGNVIDLKKRLRDEQNLTITLQDEIIELKQKLLNFDSMYSLTELENFKSLKEQFEEEQATNAGLINIRNNLLCEMQIWEQKLAVEIDNVNRLQILLDTEKHNANMMQLQDAKIIENMRDRLAAALEHESECDSLVKSEKKAKEELQKQIVLLQQKTASGSFDPNVKINDMNFELSCIKMDLGKTQRENEMYKSELHTFKNLNLLMSAELKQVKQLTEVQKEEIAKLKQNIMEVKDAENEQKEKYIRIKHEVEIKSLENENIAHLLTELQIEKNGLKKQFDELHFNLQQCRHREQELEQLLNKERECQLKYLVPDKFMQKMKELSHLLQENIIDNRRMSSIIVQMTDEKKKLMNKVKELEVELHLVTPFDDPACKADYMFAKWLKSESYRKGLIFQKRYLISLLATYQKCAFSKFKEVQYVWPEAISTSVSRRGRSRFRAIVYVVISIRRMRYIVQRWHTGKRACSPVPKTNMQHTVPVQVTEQIPNTSRPWYGDSPPSKETRSTRRNRDQPLGSVIKESVELSPLQAPTLLSQYIERFDNIQQSLNLVSDQRPT